MFQKKYFLGGLAVFAAVIFSAQVFAQADKRQKLMKEQSADSKAIKAALEAKDYATIETKAKELMGTSDRIVGLFPKGSDTGKTKATAAIWDKPDEFAKDAKALNKAASELAQAAASKDHGAVEAKVKAVSGACSGCHKAFRAKDYGN